MFNFSPNFHPNVFLQLIYVLLIYMIFVQIVYYSFQTTFLPPVLFDSHNFPLKSEVGFVEFILQLRELVSREAVPMAQLVTGRSQTWPSVLLLGQRLFCFSALFMEYQLFSDSFILALASSWAYHFLFTWYQKPQCKYLVIGHLVLEINQWQSQEAWAIFQLMGKQLTSGELRAAPSELRAIILPLLRLLVLKVGLVKWLELQFLEEINSPQRNFIENNYPSLFLAQVFWPLASLAGDG